MSQVTEQSVRFQTALASIKLIQASAVLDLTEDDFDFLTCNKVWIATDRSRARRCVEACFYGTLDFVRYPLFLFSGYGDPRDLHSFPTRRSSDPVLVAEDPAQPERPGRAGQPAESGRDGDREGPGRDRRRPQSAGQRQVGHEDQRGELDPGGQPGADALPPGPVPATEQIRAYERGQDQVDLAQVQR